MSRSDFDDRLAHHLRSIGRETCSEADVHEFALVSIKNAADSRLLHEDRADRHLLPRSQKSTTRWPQRPVRPGRTSVTTSRANGMTQICADLAAH